MKLVDLVWEEQGLAGLIELFNSLNDTYPISADRVELFAWSKAIAKAQEPGLTYMAEVKYDSYSIYIRMANRLLPYFQLYLASEVIEFPKGVSRSFYYRQILVVLDHILHTDRIDTGLVKEVKNRLPTLKKALKKARR